MIVGEGGLTRDGEEMEEEMREARGEMSGTSREREKETFHETRELDECRERPLTRETAGERARERAHTRVRLARACPNIGDTQEAKRVRPEASTERDQTPPEGEERERVTDTVSDHSVWGTGVVCNHRHQRERVTSSHSQSNTVYIGKCLVPLFGQRGLM